MLFPVPFLRLNFQFLTIHSLLSAAHFPVLKVSENECHVHKTNLNMVETRPMHANLSEHLQGDMTTTRQLNFFFAFFFFVVYLCFVLLIEYKGFISFPFVFFSVYKF